MRSPPSASNTSTCRHRRIACGEPFEPLAHNEALMYAFELLRPTTLADASAALVRSGGKALAGGQSLIGALKLRRAQPRTLVDLSQIAELKGIAGGGTRGRGSITIGAFTTHAEVAESNVVRSALPALAALARGIGDRQVRNLGTLGGSIAHADPAACYPAAVLGLGATIRMA